MTDDQFIERLTDVLGTEPDRVIALEMRDMAIARSNPPLPPETPAGWERCVDFVAFLVRQRERWGLIDG